MGLTLSGNYGAVPPTAVTTVGVAGGGLCVVNGDPGITITINGYLNTAGDVPTWTCAGGVAEGQLSFSVVHSKVQSGVTARVVLTVAMGTAVMVVGDDTVIPAFAGAGAFVRDVASLASCALGAADPMSLCGTFTFVSGNPGPRFGPSS